MVRWDLGRDARADLVGRWETTDRQLIPSGDAMIVSPGSLSSGEGIR